MPIQIIIKDKPPAWRKSQSTLDRFIRSNGDKKQDITIPVEKQYSPEELTKIINACRHTQAMGLDMNQEQDEIEVKKEHDEVMKGISKGGIILP